MSGDNGELRARSSELGDLARSIRDLTTCNTSEESAAAYEAVAQDVDRLHKEAQVREAERIGRRMKEA